MKKLIVFVVALLFATTSVSADEKRVSFDKLPVNAQKFIKKFFAKDAVKSVMTEGRSIYREYDVKLKDGSDVEFDSKGLWTKVDCATNAIPKGLIPDQVTKYVKSNFKGKFIREVERKKGAYKVELSDDTDLDFDKKFNLIKVDED